MASVSGIALFIVLVIAIAFGLTIKRNRHLHQQYEKLARHYWGTSSEAKLFDLAGPSARFQHLGTSVLVRRSTHGGHEGVVCEIDWPDTSFTCDIRGRNVLDDLRELFRWQAKTFGDRQFTRRFIVRSQSGAATSNVITPMAQSVITKLGELRHPWQLKIEWKAGRLTVSMQMFEQRAVPLIAFTALCLRLYEACCPDDGSIQFLTKQHHLELHDAVCQICGELIESEAVWCSSCDTPHHYSCWQYYGKCSTYACGETKYNRMCRSHSST